jgi:hypothetical protein
MAIYRATFTRTASTSAACGALYAPGSAMRVTEIEQVIFGATGTMSDAAFEVQVQRSTTAPTGGTAVTPLPIDPSAQAAVALAMGGTITNGTLTANQFLLDMPCHVRNTLNLWIRADRAWKLPATASNGVHINTPVGPAIVVVAQLQFGE